MKMRDPTDLPVDVVRAEPARFRHPLLLVHGLWTGNWIWRDFAGHLANRGWESWVPSLVRDDFAPTSDERLRALRDLCGSMSAAPVIVAHDAAIASCIPLAREVGAPAVVALGPWIAPASGRLEFLREPHAWAATIFAARLPPPRPPHRSLAGVEDRVSELVADSGPYFRSLFAGFPSTAASGPPGLVIAGRGDPAVPVAAAERYASNLGWSFDVHESEGHFPMVGRGSERLADRVHRWIVRSTGREMLLWDEDADSEG